ncbi:hypothetical protein, partial [Mycoplasma sp. Z244B]|uniref:hypothetical protein n=1 Tax=Mycoplasma sp. Z244B TaxID=3401659 RepID=UPI003AB0BC55
MSKITQKTSYETRKMFMYQEVGRYFEYTNKKLATMLRTSVKTIQRIKKIIRQKLSKNELFGTFAHGNRFKKKENSGLTEEQFNTIVDKYLNMVSTVFPTAAAKFSAITINDFVDRLSIEERYGFSKSHFKKLIREGGLINCFSHKKTKAYARKLEANKIKEQNSLISKSEENRLQKIIQHLKQTESPKDKKQYLNIKDNLDFGEYVEIDGCLEWFFGDRKVTLFHAVDAATGKLLAVHWEYQETALGYQRLLDKVFKQYGFPKHIVADRRRNFWWSDEVKTNFEKALNKRGIKLLTSSNPTFKPNVERSFMTAQMNYPLWISENKLNSLDELNKNSDKLVEFYNKKFNKLTIAKQNVFDNGKLWVDNPDFLIEVKRKITSGVIKKDNKYLAPFDNDGNRVYIYKSTDAVVVTDINQKTWF